MEKKRVYEIAKDFHVSSEALISMLKDMSFNVKSHMSVLEDDMLKAIQTQFSKQQNNALKEIEKKEKITKAIDQKKTTPEEPKPEDKPEPKARQRSRSRQKQGRKRILLPVKIPRKFLYMAPKKRNRAGNTGRKRKKSTRSKYKTPTKRPWRP